MNKTKKLILISLMSALSLGLYAIECSVPPVVPVPGVKIGIANIISLICLYILGAKATFAVLVIRIIISSFLFSNPVSMIFSMCGGLLSFIAMCFLKRFFSHDSIWSLSVIAAFFHNLGQILAAVIILSEPSLLYYFLILVVSSVVTGIFTGVCAQAAVKKLNSHNF